MKQLTNSLIQSAKWGEYWESNPGKMSHNHLHCHYAIFTILKNTAEHLIESLSSCEISIVNLLAEFEPLTIAIYLFYLKNGGASWYRPKFFGFSNRCNLLDLLKLHKIIGIRRIELLFLLYQSSLLTVVRYA